MHRVDGGRLGPCVEEHAKDQPKKEEDKQQELFK